MCGGVLPQNKNRTFHGLLIIYLYVILDRNKMNESKTTKRETVTVRVSLQTHKLTIGRWGVGRSMMNRTHYYGLSDTTTCSLVFLCYSFWGGLVMIRSLIGLYDTNMTPIQSPTPFLISSFIGSAHCISLNIHLEKEQRYHSLLVFLVLSMPS